MHNPIKNSKQMLIRISSCGQSLALNQKLLEKFNSHEILFWLRLWCCKMMLHQWKPSQRKNSTASIFLLPYLGFSISLSGIKHILRSRDFTNVSFDFSENLSCFKRRLKITVLKQCSQRFFVLPLELQTSDAIFSLYYKFLGGNLFLRSIISVSLVKKYRFKTIATTFCLIIDVF